MFYFNTCYFKRLSSFAWKGVSFYGHNITLLKLYSCSLFESLNYIIYLIKRCEYYPFQGCFQEPNIQRVGKIQNGSLSPKVRQVHLKVGVQGNEIKIQKRQ